MFHGIRNKVSHRIRARGDSPVKKLPREVQVRISRRIDTLAERPRPDGVKKLEGEGGLYRIRVGDYRVIYKIKDKLLLGLVLTLGKRADVYR